MGLWGEAGIGKTYTVGPWLRELPARSLSDALGTVFAGPSPFVLHLEDPHEAGPERVALVERLAALVARLRGVRLIMTSRRPLPPGVDGQRHEPLTVGGSAGGGWSGPARSGDALD